MAQRYRKIGIGSHFSSHTLHLHLQHSEHFALLNTLLSSSVYLVLAVISISCLLPIEMYIGGAWGCNVVQFCVGLNVELNVCLCCQFDQIWPIYCVFSTCRLFPIKCTVAIPFCEDIGFVWFKVSRSRFHSCHWIPMTTWSFDNLSFLQLATNYCINATIPFKQSVDYFSVDLQMPSVSGCFESWIFETK